MKHTSSVTVKNYIIAAIDAEGYGESPKTNDDKLKFVDRTFRSEYGWMIERVGYQKAFKEYLMGLPSCINIEYRNHKILEIAKSWGSLGKNATEREEDKVLEEWFDFISRMFVTMLRQVTP